MPLDIVLVLDVSGSMDDPMGRADSTKRIDALKKAVNSFIDGSAKVNDQRADVNKQNRIAVVNLPVIRRTKLEMTSTGKADLSIIIHRLSVDIRLTQVEINQKGRQQSMP